MVTLNDLRDVQKLPYPNDRKTIVLSGGVQLFSGLSSHVETGINQQERHPQVKRRL